MPKLAAARTGLPSAVAIARRGVAISAVVGTVLIAINHGDHWRAEPICRFFYAKCALCYAVPFAVSVVSGALAARGKR